MSVCGLVREPCKSPRGDAPEVFGIADLLPTRLGEATHTVFLCLFVVVASLPDIMTVSPHLISTRKGETG